MSFVVSPGRTSAMRSQDRTARAAQDRAARPLTVRRPGAEVTEEALDAFCRERLAAFKVPRVYDFRESLPKSAVGKVLRRQLVEQLSS